MDSEKFEQELAKNLEPLDTDKDLGFHTGLQTGSFPSPGKALAIASHTSPTSWMCTLHNWDVPALLLIQFNHIWFGEPRIRLGTKIQANSRIQFASNQSKLVPRKLDPPAKSNSFEFIYALILHVAMTLRNWIRLKFYLLEVIWRLHFDIYNHFVFLDMQGPSFTYWNQIISHIARMFPNLHRRKKNCSLDHLLAQLIAWQKFVSLPFLFTIFHLG
jgi:hypothetical protein